MIKTGSATLAFSSALGKRTTLLHPLMGPSPTLYVMQIKAWIDRARTEFQEAVITSLKFKKSIPHLTEIVKRVQLTNTYGISVFLIKSYCSADAYCCCVNWQQTALPGSPEREVHGRGKCAFALTLNLSDPSRTAQFVSCPLLWQYQFVPHVEQWPFLCWSLKKDY